MLKSLKEFWLTILLPLLYLLTILIILKDQTSFGFGKIYLLGLGVIFAFVGLFFWGAGYKGLGFEAFSVLPRAKILKTEGLYKYFRHPIYLGITLTFLGLSLSLGSKVGLAYTLFIIIPLNILRAIKEEEILAKKFGQEYLSYKKKTRL